jgi:hypothetical protein
MIQYLHNNKILNHQWYWCFGQHVEPAAEMAG